MADEQISALWTGKCGREIKKKKNGDRKDEKKSRVRKLLTWSPAEQIETKSARELMLTLDDVQDYETNGWQGNALRVTEYVETTCSSESPCAE